MSDTLETFGESITRVSPDIYSIDIVGFATIRMVEVTTVTASSLLATHHSVLRRRMLNLDGNRNLVLHDGVCLAIRDLNDLCWFLCATTLYSVIWNVLNETKLSGNWWSVVVV